MASIIDSSSANSPTAKTDSNNNSAININDVKATPLTEQCDAIPNGTDDKLEPVADSDEQPASSTNDHSQTILNVTSSSVDENETATNVDVPSNPANSYKDYSGIDTESFITTTLRNNRKDRTLLLSLEKLFQDLIQNDEQKSHQFQAMNSYERMIVHRVAAFFGLDHNVDKNGQSIVVTKTANTRVPPLSFQSFIPADELLDGATPTFNPSVEQTNRRISRRNDRAANPTAMPTTKPFFERSAHYSEPRDKIPNPPFNKPNRKQQRFNSNYYVQQTNMHPSSHLINTRAQPMYSPASSLYYPQPRPIHTNVKQPTTASPMYNFMPMMSPTPFQHGNGMQLPILLHQQPNGQLQYVFPTQQPHSLSADGQYMPVYRSDMMQSVVDNASCAQPSVVHLYPTHPYPHVPQTAYLPRASSFMIPPNSQTPIQYATNQLATLNLHSLHANSRYPSASNSHKSAAQLSANGLTRMPAYHHYRQSRPLNVNPTDKQLTSIENDMKSTMNHNSEQISLAEPTQEKD